MDYSTFATTKADGQMRRLRSRSPRWPELLPRLRQARPLRSVAPAPTTRARTAQEDGALRWLRERCSRGVELLSVMRKARAIRSKRNVSACARSSITATRPHSTPGDERDAQVHGLWTRCAQRAQLLPLLWNAGHWAPADPTRTNGTCSSASGTNYSALPWMRQGCIGRPCLLPILRQAGSCWTSTDGTTTRSGEAEYQVHGMRPRIPDESQFLPILRQAEHRRRSSRAFSSSTAEDQAVPELWQGCARRAEILPLLRPTGPGRSTDGHSRSRASGT